MQKYQLIVMRHAKSDWSEESCSDFERPLTTRGKKSAKQMGKWLKRRYHIDRIICSPALRTKQTCQLVTEQLRLPQNHIRWESGIYDASLHDLISVITKYSEDIRTLLLIGHNPGLDQLLCYLSRDPPATNSAGKLLTTAAIAVLDYGDAAITVQPGYACLQCLVRPKELS